MKYDNIHWLGEAEYRKSKTQLRMQAARIFDFIKVDDKLPVRYMYGLGMGVEGGVDEAIRL